jgi:hypothetical protein
MLFPWIATSVGCLADGAKITGGIEPAYTACLSAGFCSNLVRTQFRLQYKPVSIRGFSVRVRIARAYQMTMEDDRDEGVGEEQQASIFDPPYDVADVKFRFSDPNGRDRFELRTGYAYQHSDPNSVDGYHSTYLSGDYYFGGAIPSGWSGLSRRWDVLLKASDNLYAQANRPSEELDQFVSTYTTPLNNDGTTRMYASYARELRFSGSDVVRTPSNRFDVGATRYPTRWLELYGRISVFATRGISGAARAVVGADVTI